MGSLEDLFDLVGRESAIFVGLLIPFLGLLVPALVLLAIGLSHRMAPHVAAGPDDLSPDAGAAAAGFGVQSAAVAVPSGASLATPDELSWQSQSLRESDIFEGLTDDELRLVVAIGEQRHVPAGGRLADAGSRGQTLFVIMQGKIHLLSHPPAEAVVRTARAGETVPLATIIDPPVLVTSVVAGTDCEVFAIPRQPLIDLLEMYPPMGFQVYRAVARAFEHRYRHTLDHSVHEGPDGETGQS